MEQWNRVTSADVLRAIKERRGKSSRRARIQRRGKATASQVEVNRRRSLCLQSAHIDASTSLADFGRYKKSKKCGSKRL